MAIMLHLYYTGTNGSARRFADEMEQSGTAQAIRSAPGNLQYAYFFPRDDAETVLLIDRWQDQADIDRHHASPMMQTILALREKHDLRVRAERYVSDEEGIPESDAAYLRS